ncbi:TolC family protein [Mucilaginibacter mali]|uniref:TolC family protein n=1 Tax=Mucilaginibacter mali TaxID=2740462 RepID=A0A7D4UFV9_9SPHI|nr:TolC family protein [Mucilaginibacter mali]QKJ30896.1 TolC family protein [Mucilaginibacter mali]
MKNKFRFAIVPLFLLPFCLLAQVRQDSLPPLLNLNQCIQYALQNQPAVRQAGIDEAINERDIGISMAAWLPQVNSANSASHYFKGSPQAANGVANSSISNVSIIGIQATQVIYNNDVNLASKASKYSREYYKDNTISSTINVITDVSKAFYDVLLSQRQLDIIKEDIVRLQRSLKDARARYDAGVADKTDYKQATIALNNSMATRKQTEEAIKSKSAYLRQTMGMPAERPLTLAYDSTRFEGEAIIDTNQILDYTNRIEYRQLQARRNLTALNIDYYKYGFLPSLSANGAYNLNYFSNSLGNLYNQSFPNAYVGLSLNIPIFTGKRRLQNLSKARLQTDRADLDLVNSRNQINTQYVQALASYKSNYNTWQLLKQNVSLASDVYNVVSLQYREGIKTYLDVIVSQSDLRTAELNYFNALFQVLSSKVDLQKALGTVATVNK